MVNFCFRLDEVENQTEEGSNALATSSIRSLIGYQNTSRKYCLFYGLIIVRQAKSCYFEAQ